jgi:flagellin
MIALNTNTNSTLAASALKSSGRAMAGAMEQLSTGRRINSASEDAAGLAISEALTAQSRGLSMAVRNAHDAIGMVQTAEGALVEVGNMLQRMRELAVQGATGTISTTQRGYLASEAGALADQINSALANTRWNGIQVLSEESMTQGVRIQVGDTGSPERGPYNNVVQTFPGSNRVTLASWQSGVVVGDTVLISQQQPHDNVQLVGTYRVVDVAPDSSAFTVISTTMPASNVFIGAGGGTLTWRKANSEMLITGSSLVSATKAVLLGPGSDLSSAAKAAAAIEKVDAGLVALGSARANLGAAVNRLLSITDNLVNVSQNLLESRSRILDTDYGLATSELARAQIIQQAGMAALAQANQQPQTVLALLRP